MPGEDNINLNDLLGSWGGKPDAGFSKQGNKNPVKKDTTPKVPADNPACKNTGITDEGIEQSSRWKSLLSAAIMVYNTANSLRMARLQRDLAKKYLKMSEEHRERYNNAHKPLEKDLVREALKLPKYKRDKEQLYTGQMLTSVRGKNAGQIDKALSCTGRYCTGLRAAIMTELDISAREYTDTTSITNLGWAYEGLDTREPPARLQNITAIPSTAILTGSVQNKLLFSRNLQPHNWPLSQEMTLDDNIIALGAIGNSVYVATDGYPYRVQADVGCDQRECRQVHKYTQSFPMINCHVGMGAVTTPFGFIYASTDGLVMLNEAEQPRVITTEVLSQDDWRQLAPQTARLAYHKGALFVVTDNISFILWLDGNTYADVKYKKMTTISDEPVDMFETRQGELVMLFRDGKVSQWNAGNTLRPYKWLSANIDAGFLFDLTDRKSVV